MVRRELIFFGTLISWMLLFMGGIWIFPTFIKNTGYLINLIPIAVLIISVTPRYFSRRYNKWFETDPFKKK